MQSALLLADLASEPHKYGIGIVTGFVICYALSKVMNYIDRRTD